MHPVTGLGYEAFTGLDNLLTAIRKLGAAAVVDVRANATSARAGFNGADIAKACNAEGIIYQHAMTLGNPRWNRDGFAHPGPARDRAKAIFRERLTADPARTALNQIWGFARLGPVVLLCREADEHACHRRCILERFAEKDLPVELAPAPAETPALFS